MTVSDVAAKVEKVAEKCGERPRGCYDPEAAHSLEDDLYKELLVAIAEGRCKDPVACANKALETRSFDFPRYCA